MKKIISVLLLLAMLLLALASCGGKTEETAKTVKIAGIFTNYLKLFIFYL